MFISRNQVGWQAAWEQVIVKPEKKSLCWGNGLAVHSIQPVKWDMVRFHFGKTVPAFGADTVRMDCPMEIHYSKITVKEIFWAEFIELVKFSGKSTFKFIWRH